MAGIHEECGVFGIFSPQRTDLATLSYYALYALQHRGQESAGIAINDDGVFSSCRDTGLVAEVFSPEKLRRLGEGNIAVGHVRYSTTGSDSKRNIQPLLVNHYKGQMALAHNGNLTNAFPLRFFTPRQTPRLLPIRSSRNVCPHPPLKRRFPQRWIAWREPIRWSFPLPPS